MISVVYVVVKKPIIIDRSGEEKFIKSCFEVVAVMQRKNFDRKLKRRRRRVSSSSTTTTTTNILLTNVELFIKLLIDAMFDPILWSQKSRRK